MSKIHNTTAISPVENSDPSMPTMRMGEVVRFCEDLGIPGITVRFVKHQTWSGNLATHRIGNANVYSVEDVKAWIAGFRRIGTSGGDAA